MTWTREKIVDRIQRWHALYGEPPRSADWNPSAAKWAAAEWRIERYRQGDPDTGEAWPSLNAAKRMFDGSFNAAIEAAGFTPNKPGPPSRRKAVARPNTNTLPMHPEVRVALEAARAEAREALEKVAVRDRQIERLREQLAVRPKEVKPKVQTKTKTITKTKVERVIDERAVLRERRKAERAEARAEQACAERDAARREAREAKDAATRSASKLERAEGTISELREERRELRVTAEGAADRASAVERALAAARDEVARVKAESRVIVKDAPEQALIDAAEQEAGIARREAHDAEVRAARAEREYRELAAAVTGEPRKLTAAELAGLRRGGPAGPVLMASALKKLASARKDGSKVGMAAALTDVMVAAANWKDRL